MVVANVALLILARHDYYYDVTLASWRSKSTTPRLCGQQLVHTNTKLNIKAPYSLSLVKGIIRWLVHRSSVDSLHKGRVMQNVDVFFGVNLKRPLTKQWELPGIASWIKIYTSNLFSKRIQSIALLIFVLGNQLENGYIRSEGHTIDGFTFHKVRVIVTLLVFSLGRDN